MNDDVKANKENHSIKNPTNTPVPKKSWLRMPDDLVRNLIEKS